MIDELGEGTIVTAVQYGAPISRVFDSNLKELEFAVAFGHIGACFPSFRRFACFLQATVCVRL